MNRWLAHRWYDLTFVCTALPSVLAYSLRVAGQANFPGSGPVLLLANHASFLDPLLVGIAAPRRLTFLARQNLFGNRLFGGLIRSLDTIGIDQEGLGRDGLVQSIDRLRRGQCLLVFPEGARTFDGAMRPLKPGITMLVKRIDAPVVPVGLVGTFAALPRVRRTPRFSPRVLRATPAAVAVSFGPPIPAAELRSLPRDEALDRVARAISAEIDRAEAIRRKP